MCAYTWPNLAILSSADTERERERERNDRKEMIVNNSLAVSVSYFTHNYLRLSLSKYDRNNSQILSFAFDFFIYWIIAPDLGLVVD